MSRKRRVSRIRFPKGEQRSSDRLKKVSRGHHAHLSGSGYHRVQTEYYRKGRNSFDLCLKV